jgi:hypothetical protein
LSVANHGVHFSTEPGARASVFASEPS